MARKGVITYDLFLDGAPTDQISSAISKRFFPLDENLIELATFGTRRTRYLGVGTELQQGYFMDPNSQVGWIGFNYLLDMLMNRIWVFPTRIAGGFITEEQLHTITIWNAYLERSVDWTAISVIREPGTQFDYPAFPYSFAPTASIDRTLTIDKDGPPLQDTYYLLTIDGELFEIYIDGIRIIPLEPDPNWGQDVRTSYEFQTVMYNTPRLHEQRRALQEIAHRKLSFEFNLERIEHQRTFNRVAYGHDKIFGVPIYSEKMYVTAATAGTNIIDVSNSNEFMWNMQNRTQFIILMDHEDQVVEIKEILTVTDYQIVLKTNIVETFELSKTYCYPCLFCTVSAAKYNEKTSHVQIANLDFKEFIPSG
jgi:hypothetical protein